MHEIVRTFCISFSPVCFHFFFYYKIEHKNLFTDAVFVINYFSLKFPQLFLWQYAKELHVCFFTDNK